MQVARSSCARAPNETGSPGSPGCGAKSSRICSWPANDDREPRQLACSSFAAAEADGAAAARPATASKAVTKNTRKRVISNLLVLTTLRGGPPCFPLDPGSQKRIETSCVHAGTSYWGLNAASWARPGPSTRTPAGCGEKLDPDAGSVSSERVEEGATRPVRLRRREVGDQCIPP